MARDSILQVRMDSRVKEQAEIVYESEGTSLAEAVRVLPMGEQHIRQTLLDNLEYYGVQRYRARMFLMLKIKNT